MRNFTIISLSALLLWACGKTEPEQPVVPPVDPAPKAVTLNISSFSAEAEGGSFEVTVKAPFVPQVDKPDWVSVSTGSLVNYTVTVKLTVAPNTAFESRSATLTFKATGATSATFSLTQAAAEQPGCRAAGTGAHGDFHNTYNGRRYPEGQRPVHLFIQPVRQKDPFFGSSRC